MTHEEATEQLKSAKAELTIGNYDKAEMICSKITVDTKTYEENHTNALLIHAESLRQQGKFDQSLVLAEAALTLSVAHNHKNIKAKAWNILGLMYWDYGDYAKALEYYNHSLASFEELGDNSAAATVMNNIGLVYKELGDFPQALEYYECALATHEKLVDISGVAVVTGNIGIVYSALGNYAQALEYYNRALALREDLGAKSMIAIMLGNIGNVYHKLGDYTQALEYHSRALSTNEILGAKLSGAIVMGNIGNVYKDLGDYAQALEYYSRALASHEELGAKSYTCIVLGNIGNVYATAEFESYDASKAEEYFLNAAMISEEIGNKHRLYVVYKSLAELYEREKRWEEANIHLRKFYDLQTEVQSEEATKQAQLMEHRRKIEEAERDRKVKLARFQEQEKILHNILPSQIAERMLDGEKTIADTHKSVSVFFSDIVGFTKLSQKITAEELVGMLNGIFSQFDQLCRKHGLEKIKTIGDAYMAVSGAPTPQEHHARSAALFALEVADMMKNYTTTTGERIDIRIGLHSGTVVAGIIGENKFAYDLWGDAVNTASRMESHGEAGKIHVSEEFRNAVGSEFIFIDRGEMDIKGKGMMKTYFLEKKV